jgi:hypothetical protein
MAIVSLALHCSVASVPTQNLFGILFMPEAANVFAQSMDKFGMQPRRSVLELAYTLYITHGFMLCLRLLTIAKHSPMNHM